MKYAVIAALLASVTTAKPTGCKTGIKGAFYSDKNCKTDVKSSFTFMEKHTKETGKCNSHKATEDDHLALKTSAEHFKKAEKASKAQKLIVDKLDLIEVDDPSVEENVAKKQVKLESVAVFFKKEYPELKELYVAKQDAAAAYDTYFKTFKSTTE
jgi:hypothetical protein